MTPRERSTPEAYGNASDPLVQGGQNSLYQIMRMSLIEGVNINTGTSS